MECSTEPAARTLNAIVLRLREAHTWTVSAVEFAAMGIALVCEEAFRSSSSSALHESIISIEHSTPSTSNSDAVTACQACHLRFVSHIFGSKCSDSNFLVLTHGFFRPENLSTINISRKYLLKRPVIRTFCICLLHESPI